MNFQKLRQRIPELLNRLDMVSTHPQWAGIDAVLPLLEKMRQDGAVVLIKFDGLRTDPEDNGPYTLLVSGEPLFGDCIRIDCQELEDGLAYVIIEYAQRVWGFK